MYLIGQLRKDGLRETEMERERERERDRQRDRQTETEIQMNSWRKTEKETGLYLHHGA